MVYTNLKHSSVIQDYISLKGLPFALKDKVIIAVVTIFLFKNRSLQMNIIKGFLVLGLVGLGVLGFTFKNVFDTFSDTANGTFNINYLGCIAPFLSIVLGVLAYRSIKKDDDLVRSSDRLR